MIVHKQILRNRQFKISGVLTQSFIVKMPILPLLHLKYHFIWKTYKLLGELMMYLAHGQTNRDTTIENMSYSKNK